MFRRSISQKTIFLSLDPEINCILWFGFQATELTESLCPTKLWIYIKDLSTFLLRFLMSQKQTSPSSPPDNKRWGLFLFKSTEYTYPVWAFLLRIGSESFDLMSQLNRKIVTCISFHLAELSRIVSHRNLTISHPIHLHLQSRIESMHLNWPNQRGIFFCHLILREVFHFPKDSKPIQILNFNVHLT